MRNIALQTFPAQPCAELLFDGHQESTKDYAGLAMESGAASVWDRFSGVKDNVMMCHASLSNSASPAQYHGDMETRPHRSKCCRQC